jgi:flagellar biosynthesis/type III secretory pathway M-ring protein FliF/YscJ
LKRKSNGVLVEYARKRDSCSFLISNLILEEYSNDFHIYSSNKFGSNKDRAAKLTIENRDFLAKNGENETEEEAKAKANKQITYFVCVAFVSTLLFLLVCCLLMRCKRERPAHNGASNHKDKMLRYSNHHQNGLIMTNYTNHTNINSSNDLQFEYSAPIRNGGKYSAYQYSSGTMTNTSVKQKNGHLVEENLQNNGWDSISYIKY